MVLLDSARLWCSASSVRLLFILLFVLRLMYGLYGLMMYKETEVYMSWYLFLVKRGLLLFSFRKILAYSKNLSLFKNFETYSKNMSIRKIYPKILLFEISRVLLFENFFTRNFDHVSSDFSDHKFRRAFPMIFSNSLA